MLALLESLGIVTVVLVVCPVLALWDRGRAADIWWDGWTTAGELVGLVEEDD